MIHPTKNQENKGVLKAVIDINKPFQALLPAIKYTLSPYNISAVPLKWAILDIQIMFTYTFGSAPSRELLLLWLTAVTIQLSLLICLNDRDKNNLGTTVALNVVQI